MIDASSYDFSIDGYIAWLSSLDGTSAATNSIDGNYGDLVAPCGPQSDRAYLCGVTPPGAPNSGCMVVQCGAVEVFFISHGKPTPLRAPIGFDRWDVMARWSALQGALIAPGAWTQEAGDIALLFTPPNHQHWVGLTENKGGGFWGTIEGGELDGVFQCVQKKQRQFVYLSGRWQEVYSRHDVVQIVRVRTLIERA